MLMLQLGNIRFASLLHRDPKSFPAKIQAPQLRHSKDSTHDPLWAESTCQDMSKLLPLVNLIAYYGHMSNTSWTEDQSWIWRHNRNSLGFHSRIRYTAWQSMCDVSQYTRVASAFLKRLKGERFYQKSILMLVGPVYKMYQAPGLVGRRLHARLKSVLMLQIDRVA